MTDINQAFAPIMNMHEANAMPTVFVPNETQGSYGELQPPVMQAVGTQQQAASSPPQYNPNSFVGLNQPRAPPPSNTQPANRSTPIVRQKRQSVERSQPTSSNNNNGGYFDVLASRRRDLIKLVILAMVVVLGISIHSLMNFAINEWIVIYKMNLKKESILRGVYPIVVLFMIWNLKAFF